MPTQSPLRLELTTHLLAPARCFAAISAKRDLRPRSERKLPTGSHCECHWDCSVQA